MMEAIKNPKADGILVRTLVVKNDFGLGCKICAVLMHENRIVCLNNKNTYFVDLKPIDRLRCPESC